jgi:hypothetical protein
MQGPAIALIKYMGNIPPLVSAHIATTALVVPGVDDKVPTVNITLARAAPANKPGNS